MKMTPKLKLAEMIYKNKKLTQEEKIESLKEIKDLKESELEEWLQIDEMFGGKITEGFAGTALKVGAGALAAGFVAKKIKTQLNSCVQNCKMVFSKTGDKTLFAKCMAGCKNKGATIR